MRIIADSGSTKTIWVDVESGKKVVTEGLNPHFSSDEQVLAACDVVKKEFFKNRGRGRPRTMFQVSSFKFQLYFYGAGCGNAMQRERMVRLLSAGLQTDKVSVETDMLGACHAVSWGKESIVAILGTGSNACLYDGKEIVWQPRSTGYVMGDEGSANHVGRILLNDYLTEKMPEEVRGLFHERYNMSDDELIDAVYHKPNPNRFLASLAPFAVANEGIPYCGKVLHEALNSWYQGPVSTIMLRAHYSEGEINIVGGFAKAIEKQIHDFFEGTRLHVGEIVADPIEGLRGKLRIEN